MQFIRLDNKSINNAYSPLQLLILPWFPTSAHPPLSSIFFLVLLLLQCKVM
jgi:hypothetical protein